MKPYCVFCPRSDHSTVDCPKQHLPASVTRTEPMARHQPAPDVRNQRPDVAGLRPVEHESGQADFTREFFQEAGRRRWAGKSEAERKAHGKMMAEARVRKERNG